MNKMYYLRIFMCILLLGCLSSVYAQYPAGSPVALNGKLSVSGKNLQNECSKNVQLRGMSTHGLQWFEPCLNGGSLDALTNDWKIDILRLAMYVNETGYSVNPDKWKPYIDNMVDECQKRGIYCLIDWHVTTPGDPNADLTLAKDFWTYMSKKHAGKKHVLYEICNEPSSVSWSTIKNYANAIIPLIRANDQASIIVVGTPEYSSRPDQVVGNALSGSNLMYALHFYSGNTDHNARYPGFATSAMNAGLAVFVTEFGTTGSTGDGAYSPGATDTWMSFMSTNNISWCNWNYSDNAQLSSALTAGSCGKSSWNSTTPSGTYIKGKVSSADGFTDCKTNVVPPVISISAPLNNASLITPTDLTITASATSTVGTISKVEFFNGSTSLGSATTAPYTITVPKAATGTYFIKAIATTSGNIQGLSSGVTVYVNEPQAPYGTSAITIGSAKVKIEAENYDKGGNNNAYYDNSAGNSGPAKYRPTDDVDLEGTGPNYTVGFTAATEWMEYSVNVEGTSSYSIGVNVASQPGGKIHVEVDGVDVTKSITVPAGSWTGWSTITVQGINMTFGAHIIRLVFETNDVNVDFLEVTRTGVVTNVLNSDGTTGSTLYPNPSNNTFMLEAANDVRNISVSNLFGQVVETKENINAGTTLELGSGLETGTYTMKVIYVSGATQVIKMSKVK